MRIANRSVGSVLAIAGALALVTSPSLAQQTRSQAGQAQAVVGGYHVVLLVGDDKENPANTTPAGDGLTPAITKALKDVQQFLPFKSYRVCDSTFIRGENGSTSLKGPSNVIYVASINSNRDRASNDDGYAVRLVLSPSDTAIVATEANRPRAVLNTDFHVAVGETIVAGTSRQTHSGAALIVVVTALPPSALRH